MSASAVTTTNSSASVHQNINPSEVGWQFVPQYYTFVNKQPHRLHCFYTKNSTFIHGTEGEEGRACNGQLEIHQKIMQIGFHDCKVFIHSVDAQASAAGGIIIQVIGEMSNRGEPWRKFVQTFFLAEQPNGYFVLNDIFRFLKEETIEEDETAEAADVQADASLAPILEKQLEPEPTPSVNIPSAPAAAYQSEATAEPVPEFASPVEEPKVNGVHQLDATPEDIEATVSEPIEEKEPEPEPEPEAPATAAITEATSLPPPPPVSAAPQATPPKAPSASLAASAQPTAPPQPKTWAHLAAADRGKWGSTVAQEAQGVTEKKAAPSPTRSGAQTPVDPQISQERSQKQHRDGFQHQGERKVQIDTKSSEVYVRGVVDGVSEERLREALTKYGSIVKIDIVRNRTCAFVQYEQIESAKGAIAASTQSERGGIPVDIGQEKPYIIHIERKMEKNERPAARRGGAGGGPGGHFRGQDGFRPHEDRGGAYRNQQEGRDGRNRGRGRGGTPPSGQRKAN